MNRRDYHLTPLALILEASGIEKNPEHHKSRRPTANPLLPILPRTSKVMQRSPSSALARFDSWVKMKVNLISCGSSREQSCRHGDPDYSPDFRSCAFGARRMAGSHPVPATSRSAKAASSLFFMELHVGPTTLFTSRNASIIATLLMRLK